MHIYNKIWVKTECSYQLILDDALVGELTILKKYKFPLHTVHFVIKDNIYTLKNTGAWESTIFVLNENHDPIFYSFHHKWRFKSYIIQYNHQTYAIHYDHSLKPTWHLTQNKKNIISYSLIKSTGVIHINEYNNNIRNHLIFDFILMYFLVF